MSPSDEDYRKHYEIIEFCNAREVSIPKETVEFFKDGMDGEDINDLRISDVLERLREGLPVDIESEGDVMYGDGVFINVADIPKNVTRIQVYASH